MSEPSDWPLSIDALRVIVPRGILSQLENDALSKGLYPLALGYYPKAHRHAMKRQVHDDYLLMYCIDGEGDLRLGADTYAISEGDVLLLEPGQAHAYAARHENPWSLFWFHFRGLDATSYRDYLSSCSTFPVIRHKSDLNLQAQFRALMSTVTAGYSQPIFIHAGNQIRLILSHISWMESQKAHRESLDSVSRVSAFMRDNLHRSLSLEELAELSGLSKYHFNRRYKSLTGYSPVQHFTHMKVEQACLFLEGSDLSVAQISFKLGYEDPLYFSRVFRKILGVSPSAYRRGF